MEIRDRIKKLVRVKASSLRKCPLNWRTHNDEQKQALQAILKEVGIAGAVLVRELKDGTYALIDGHLRQGELGDQKIPCLVLDVDEEEANKLLLAYDPLSQMAGTDQEALQKLLKDVDTDSPALASLFSSLSKQAEISAKDLEMDLIDDGGGAVKPGEAVVQESQVRMVQLFLNVATLPKFEKMIKALAEEYSTKNLTDTVFTCLHRACKKMEQAA